MSGRIVVTAVDEHMQKQLILDFGDLFNGRIPIQFALGGNIYHGTVEMSGFDKDAPLSEDRLDANNRYDDVKNWPEYRRGDGLGDQKG